MMGDGGGKAASHRTGAPPRDGVERMDGARELLRRLWRSARNADQRRQRLWLAVGSAAMVILLLTGSLLLFSGIGSGPHKAMLAPTLALSTATNTATASPRPTSTHPAPTAVPPPPTKIIAPPPPPPPSTPTPPPVTPTVGFCPTPTPAPPAPTATATTQATGTATGSPTATSTPIPPTATPGGCVSCPYYMGNNPSDAQIAGALDTAAAKYGLPKNLVRAVAWQESKWHEDVTSCDGGVGLMQIQYYYADYFNGLSYGACGFGQTNDDIHTLAGNADLGAKVLKYLQCYYDFGGPYGGTASQPANGSSEYYYFTHSPPLPYPDTSVSGSFCAGVYNDPSRPQYQALPLGAPAEWSCPYSPNASDSTLLDLVLSAYNAGQGAIYNCSCIPNPWYVQSVEGFIPQFNAGALP